MNRRRARGRRGSGDDLAEANAALGDAHQLAAPVADQVRAGGRVPLLEVPDDLAHVPVGQLVLEGDTTAEVLGADAVLTWVHGPTVAAPDRTDKREWTLPARSG